MPPPREPTLSTEEREALRKGVREFNQGLYFECHDTLEELWSGVRGDGRDFFQGLIQVAVGYYHAGNGNAVGASSMFERALLRLEKYPPRYFGFDLQRQRELLQGLLAGPAQDPAALLRPEWSFDDPVSAGS